MVVAWVLIYLFTRKSAHSVGKVVWVTATLPFLFLLLLTIRAVTLPGAGEGFSMLTQVDRSRIGDLDVWLAAA
jgi:SNF family Na+-dependent transporter